MGSRRGLDYRFTTTGSEIEPAALGQHSLGSGRELPVSFMQYKASSEASGSGDLLAHPDEYAARRFSLAGP